MAQDMDLQDNCEQLSCTVAGRDGARCGLETDPSRVD
jgi:hypothetical protein